ncbi:MAG: class III extradiol ring-cleavage dioxygenase [Luteibacter sp.]|jgi:4,5-DOPA dioxygenase extradiol|uniref:dioxygenase family protein n=1 Tax=Luteibacter sp. TaxID=1886636 RepID=UPI002807FF34|nr:class III extradiol ring-cleavage dioxygenase [Luteibacter sp.]MDQ7996852.1 class III extradiol ring-cleavage dioxygenase [Luteibacter sp.]MDQ8049223.1 class III extradiol ring-cleavage dioxygenase [Luteibacter sp.]
MSTTPVIFISHGAPTFALDPGLLGPALQRFGAGLIDIRAVLVVSPHWQAQGLTVMTGERPATLHDFRGFPEALYRLQYPAPGAPDVARETALLLQEAGYTVHADATRPRDHGAWSPLRFLLPAATLPVFQLAMPYDLDAAGALALGRALRPLRDRGVLIVGSGSLTHNLYDIRMTADVAPYAQAFADWTSKRLVARDAGALEDYRRIAPSAERAHPTEEHYLPLLVAFGASDEADRFEVLHGGMTYGVLSMDSYAWSAAT